MVMNTIPEIAKMTIREKVEQTMVIMVHRKEELTFSPGAAFFFGQIITQADETGVAELREFVNTFYDSSKIPPLITSDFENGCGSMIKGLTPLPFLMGLGATHDPALAYDYGKATALEARSVGANWTFSPICDLNKNPRNPLVATRALTDDENLAEAMLPQIVKGMQDYGLSACAKHFPGDGMDYRDQHITPTMNHLPIDEWTDSYGRVYKALIAAGVNSVMAGHITLPSYPQELDAKHMMPLPATLCKELISELLKRDLGFEGIVVTDALNMGGFHGWYETKEVAEIESFKAGCDMMLWPSKNYADNLEKAVISGDIPIERLDDAVSRILRVKQKLGLFEPDHKRFYDMTEEDRAFVSGVQKRCAEQSITLVRDKVGHFPIARNRVKTIGVVVLTEHEPFIQEAIGIKTEFEKRGFAVNFFAGEQFEDDERVDFYEACDLVIYAMYSRPFRPIGFIDYTQGRAWQIAKAFWPPLAWEKTVFVSFGSPYFGNQYLERASTYVNAYSALDCAGKAFVKAACGEIAFQGKSPVKI